MKATMMDLPLSTQMILRHGARVHGASRVGSFDGTTFHFATFAEVAARATALASALTALGIQRGERVATYCWNHQAHLEAYLAVPAAHRHDQPLDGGGTAAALLAGQLGLLQSELQAREDKLARAAGAALLRQQRFLPSKIVGRGD